MRVEVVTEIGGTERCEGPGGDAVGGVVAVAAETEGWGPDG